MPSGRTHDAITFLIAAPTFGVTYYFTNSLLLAAAVTLGTLFGGLMFGPDLDIQSKQYTRWGVFRFLWLPYKVVFRHRSRLSHGIIFGTLIRVIYFAGVLSLLVVGAVYLRAIFYAQSPAPDFAHIAHAWRAIRLAAADYGVNSNAVWSFLIGAWWGAATHTIADVTWSVMKKSTEIF